MKKSGTIKRMKKMPKKTGKSKGKKPVKTAGFLDSNSKRDKAMGKLMSKKTS